MYHVVGTGSTAIILYLLSYLFYRTGFYSRNLHRKLWNTILALAFILTVSAGIFLALQVTYKWDIPFIKSILKWHVEFGVAMSFTGLFHLIWHFSYYTELFKKSDYHFKEPVFQVFSSADISTNLLMVGFVSSSVQLLLIREMLNVTGGYELITGIFLGSWLLTSAAGSVLAGKSDLNDLKRINLLFSISPFFSIALLLFLSRLLLSTGQTPSLLGSIIYTLIMLLPFCFISGFTFIKLLSSARSVNRYEAGRSFSVETTGGIVAGLIITFLTSGFLNTYQLLLLVTLFAISYSLLTYYVRKVNAGLILKIIVALAAATIIIFNADIFFRQILMPGVTIVNTTDTPYGNITTGNYKGELSTYYNQRLLSYKEDVIEREEDVHYAMLQCTDPGNVMLISGALNSHLKEIEKYPVKSIVYIERDPELTRSLMTYADTLPNKLSIINDDALKYIRKNNELFDVVLVLVPPPATLQLNRYYTTEFFREVKSKMNDGGIFMCSPGQGQDYFNKESVQLYSSIFNSMSNVFRNVMPIVGHKLYFIASDSELSTSVCSLAGEKNIRNIYVGPDYLADDLIASRTNNFLKIIDHEARENSEAYPVATFHFQSFNLSKTLSEKWVVIILLISLFATPVFAAGKKNFIMYSCAAALAGFEIIILLSLQLILGNMYQLTGIILAGLMAGLAVGAGSRIRFNVSSTAIYIPLILSAFYLMFGFAYNKILTIQYGFPAMILLVVSSFIPAMFTGHLFRSLTRGAGGRDTTPAVYSADLTGSAFGFIITAAIVVPAFGIKISLYLLAGIVFAGFLQYLTGIKR
jgi:spermidine synthase